MRKTVVATFLVASIALAGCESNKDGNIEPSPAPVPSTVESQSTKPVEPSNEPTQTREPKPEPEPTRTTEKPDPGPVVTTSEAGTPATQFAQRWGVKYPAVPEYAILKAAKGTCLLIETGGVDWFSDPAIMAGITEVVSGFGMQSKDALEFAQDADQNYCSSIVNPT